LTVSIDTNGEHINALRDYLSSTDHISPDAFKNILQDACEVYKECLPLNQKKSKQGLIYGHIQSGKTAVIIATMALAADNGYKKFIMLTSNFNDLYEQTLERVRKSLDFEVVEKNDFSRHSGLSSHLPMVLVSSKNAIVLKKLSKLVDELNWQHEPVMIIDDEADQASLNTNINKKDELSPINRWIQVLRDCDFHVYLQTTATPQALFLQDEGDAFLPEFVISTRAGNGYIGGNYFFENDDFGSSKHIEIVDAIDVGRLRTSNQIPNSVAESIVLFFLASAILRLQESTHNTQNYTYLLHTSFKQNDHTLSTKLVEEFKNQFAIELGIADRRSIDDIEPSFKKKLESSYANLQKTFNNIPKLEDILKEAAKKIASTQVKEINAKTGGGVDRDPLSRHTLYIGGTKISRGVTVKNLLVTYYGRDTKSGIAQIDTVLQHARMYGYRQNELPAIRIYLPLHLAQRFYDIHQTDNDMRLLCQSIKAPIREIPLANKDLKPSRRNVLNKKTVLLKAYVAKSQHFPNVPISELNELGNQTNELDVLLSEEKYSKVRYPYFVTIDDVLEILNFKFAASNSSSAWNDELIRQTFSLMKEKEWENKATLIIVNRSSKLKKHKSRQYEKLATVLPGREKKDPLYGAPKNYPILFMTRLTGEKHFQGGWHGVPFWIPVVRFPDGGYAFSINTTAK